MKGQWVAPLSECGIGAALQQLKANGLAEAPMLQPLNADVMRRRAAGFPADRRALLVKVLTEQAGPNASEVQRALLLRLAQPDSVTVVAGHQLVTGLGPLYVHAKVAETGGANSVREDRMCLKVNGTDCIYGCYSHSSIMSTFHRRCYWLLDKPDIVLVHYLQTPNGETGECLVYLNSNAIASTQPNDALNTSNASSSDNQLNKDDLKAELKSMLWPFYFDQNFINENLKTVNTAISGQTPSPNDFIELILGKMLTSAGNGQIQPIRINLVSYLNQSTQDILAKAKLDLANSSKYSSNMKDELNSLFNKQHIVNSYNVT
jgi:hypothetical protein